MGKMAVAFLLIIDNFALYARVITAILQEIASFKRERTCAVGVALCWERACMHGT